VSLRWPGRPVGVGFKTAHENCHGEPLLAGHDHSGVDCDTCQVAANIAANAEARLCYEHFNRVRDL
jgi:hypothetical protein